MRPKVLVLWQEIGLFAKALTLQGTEVESMKELTELLVAFLVPLQFQNNWGKPNVQGSAIQPYKDC